MHTNWPVQKIALNLLSLQFLMKKHNNEINYNIFIKLFIQHYNFYILDQTAATSVIRLQRPLLGCNVRYEWVVTLCISYRLIARWNNILTKFVFRRNVIFGFC
jgi:hypothetical protein